MILSKKTKHGLLSMGLAFGILTSSVVSPASVSVLASDYSARNVLSDAYIQSQFPAPISEENITSASVRSEALQLQSSKRAFDLDLSGQSFDGSGGIDYSKNAKYMDVLKNLKTTQNDQTIILRFKTSSDGLLFGAGSDALTTTGKNMTVSIRDGKLRLVMRNTKKADGAPAGGLKGSFNVSLADGNWHTVAISFLPSLNYVNDNVRIAVDGTDLNYASNTWGSSWKAGFNQGAGADYNLLQIGGGSYVGVNNNDYASANFNGKIDFITVIDKAYSMDDLKSISYEQVSSVTAKLNAMRQSGTGKTWGIFAKHDPRSICRITDYGGKNGVRFDAYHCQDVLVLEEFHSQIPISAMLNYLDIYPLTLPARYTDRVACYTTVYITSNVPLSEQYMDIQRYQLETWRAFLRRVQNIIEYLPDGSTIRHKKGGLPL